MDDNLSPKLMELAQTFAGYLLKADFKAASNLFDDQMKTSLSEEQLQETWQNLISDAGGLLQIVPSRSTDVEGYKVIIIKCYFQRAEIDVQVVFNHKKQISGLYFIPVQTIYNPPAYVNESAFKELDVTVGEGKWAVPGTMTMPYGSGPFPGVVLVHGSGPNDRDETIGPNKTFRDLAWGLSSQGIAVLRYDKRTFKHSKEFTPDLINKMTVKEEVIEDALLAIQLMCRTEGIDPENVFLLGHSLGATLAPRIGQMDTELAGLIIMAGITRPLEDTILDQFTYIYSLNGEMNEQQKRELEELKAKVDRLKSNEILKNISPQELPLGIPIAYWLDLREHKPLDSVKKLNMHILILQGGRDYQVLAVKDFEGWKSVLNHKKNVTFKLFPELNHLFIEGQGKSTPQEYLVEGHVKENVISTIVQWIKEIINQ